MVVDEREVLGWSWRFAAVAVLTGPVGATVVVEHLRPPPAVTRHLLVAGKAAR